MRYAYIGVNGIIIILGYLAFVHTDLNSGDRFHGAVLPLVDMVYCIYLLILLFGEIYNRTWR